MTKQNCLDNENKRKRSGSIFSIILYVNQACRENYILFQQPSSRIYESGDFDAVKQYIQNEIILGEKAVSMIVLHNIYGLNSGDNRYRNKLKKIIEQNVPSQLLFVTA